MTFTYADSKLIWDIALTMVILGCLGYLIKVLFTNKE